MNKRLLIAFAIVAVAFVAFMLRPSSLPKQEKEALDGGVTGPTIARDGRSLIPPSELPQGIQQPHPEHREKDAPEEKKEKSVAEEKIPPLPENVEEKDLPMHGLEVEEANAGELRDLKVPEGMTGVIVKNVDPGSPAREAMLEKGDVIVRAQRDTITDAESLKRYVNSRSFTVITAYRNGFPIQVVLQKPFHGDH